VRGRVQTTWAASGARVFAWSTVSGRGEFNLGAQLAEEDAREDARAATCCHAAWFLPIRSSSFAIRSLTNLPTNSKRRPTKFMAII
jgi:hypothetical protein